MSELSRLVGDLTREATVTPLEARGVVQRGCLNIKQDWRERASGIKHAPRYPQSITYDTRVLAGSVIGEVGPENGTGDSNHQGFLGEILEHGGAHNAPRNDGAAALAAETPRFEAALAALAGRHLAR
jgi:hypothetical protein